MAGKYLESLGLGTMQPAPAELSFPGIARWAISKSPALLGGLLADYVYRAAVRKWPNHRRGAAFVGGVAVVLAAYALQLGLQRLARNATQMADRISDGMIGRVSEAVVVVFRSFWHEQPGGSAVPATPAQKQLPGLPLSGTPVKPTASIDGDEESVREVAALLAASPEMTQDLADQMFAIMDKDGVKIDADGKKAVVQSLRQATKDVSERRA